jgi:hypothetical protein
MRRDEREGGVGEGRREGGRKTEGQEEREKENEEKIKRKSGTAREHGCEQDLMILTAGYNLY